MRISDWSSDVCSSDLDGAVAPQPGQGRRTLAGRAAVEWRYRAAVPPRHPQAVLRPVPDLRRTEGGYAAGAGLRHRRQPLGSPAGVAAELRRGLRGNVEAAVPARRRRALVRGAGGGAGREIGRATVRTPV